MVGSGHPLIVKEVREIIPDEKHVSVTLGVVPNQPGTVAMATHAAASLKATSVKVGFIKADYETALDELKEAKIHLKEAEKKNTHLKRSLKNSPELRFAGYIVEAEKELVEASLVYGYELNGHILSYKEMDVSASSYIQGIGDAIGEWRRKALDHLRKLDLENGEKYLNIMESGMEILNELDYPDALTGGLRRYADNARALIERTRSDITNAVVNDSLRKDLSKIKK